MGLWKIFSWTRILNRFANFLLACLAFLILMPVMGLVATAVYFLIGRPVIFSQDRPGMNERIFRLYKFRTLSNATGADGTPLPDALRMTPFGNLLRKTSLDELPELWNVLKGDMNLVGPRPLLVEYLPLYTPEQRRRHAVPPGITGWAQIHGRNRLSWEEKFALDLWYVEHRSALLDLKIIARTLLALFRTGEVSQEGHATAEKFEGKK